MKPKPFHPWSYEYNKAYEKGRTNKWDYLRFWAKDHGISKDAQLRLEWIIFYHTVAKKNAKYSATYFGISRKTFHKWLGRFDEGNLISLEEQSRIPKKVRGWMVTEREENRIKDLREKNMEFGKKKIKRIYFRDYGEDISTWKIERVIRKHKLYPDPVKHKYLIEKRRNSKPKIRIHEIRDQIKQIKEFGFLWHIDAIIIWWYGTRRIIFTALEGITKIAFARVYTTNTSGYAEDFLKRLIYLVEGKVNIMHQDNGSEFKGAFERACETLGILQIYSRPYTPKDNPALERFNSTIQYEWLKYSEVGLDDILEANIDLTTWLVKYNSYRPHETLDNLTPLEYAQQNFFQVLPMWSARTLPR
ncbi:MAG: integrase core domain-containing protein [Candidatus Daviesbacteria bacterium]|nr:integrase core domain-containing protein [Candidatus Daviesbacteria bacterium]